MSYTYLQAQGVASSVDSYSDIPQSVLLRLRIIGDKCYSKDNVTEYFHDSQSGMMLKPLMEPPGLIRSMSYARVSHVRTLALLAKGTVSKENAAVFGVMSLDSLASFDLTSSTWRTRQLSLLEDLNESLERLPSWGMMLVGQCWEAVTLVYPSKEKGYGFWPAPLKNDFKGGTASLRKDGKSRNAELRHLLKAKHGLTYPIPEHSEALMYQPIGQTDLKPLAIAKYQSWLLAHGSFWEGNRI